MTNFSARRRSADAQGGKLKSTQIWLRSCGSSVTLMQGEAAPYRMLSDKSDPPYGLKHMTPLFGIAVSVIPSIPLWGVLGLVAWAIFR